MALSSVTAAPAQVTYVPDRHCFAVWHADGARDGAAVVIDLVVPASDGALATTPVRALMVDAADTAALEHAAGGDGGASASARAWIDIARHRDGRGRTVPIPAALVDAVPIAGRAVPDGGGTRIATADSVVASFDSASARLADLRDAGVDFTARPYQLRGIAWMSEKHFTGGILSDEMGLGKTLQAVAHMLLLARAGRGPFLVVCPTSLLSNWRREISRFAGDSLGALVYRGPDRVLPGRLHTNTVVITGYSTLRTDIDVLRSIEWHAAYFDEAHMLKNSRTKVARAARAVNARLRIALTGTPVENHMEELWSLLDLVRPNLLGTRARFVRRFAQPIEQYGSAAALEGLTHAIEPVVLRRTKAAVATDLPPKNHVDLTVSVTAEQARLYNSALDDAFDSGFGGGGARGSRILALLTKLKLICNHPHLVDAGNAEMSGRSGKLDRLTEIVTELGDTDSRALIFTQYRRTGEMLAAHLSDATDRDVPFFHGGLNPDKRDRMIADFRESTESPAMILSLRAAGYGLNLTEADTVVHFDRWWNPAVEAQATDRAHRIGQTSPVTVITLTTEGTLEEYIADLHQRKKAISALTESNAAAALAALDDMDLRSTLSLREVR